MSAFNKNPKIECDFRDAVVNLESGTPSQILGVTVCVRNKNKNVKLDWSVCEFLSSLDLDGPSEVLEVSPNAAVEYTLCRNGVMIGSTVTSSHRIDSLLNIPGVSDATQTLSFEHESQPNFTFCDENPVCGVNNYELKALLLQPGDGATSVATLLDRSLAAVCFDKK
ncbi:hypothetical protein VQL36_10745 [Chengkuizengella sp. SCS-71B]|uniref:hypothetical protein n=1 Tax=Chengkuizengella sp. SCS-71B TaxID=3115290 RepID=UPI0032C23E61